MEGIKELDRYMTLDQASPLLRPGDVLFYRGVGIVSLIIRTVTSYPPSLVSHVGLLGDHRDGEGNITDWSVIEVREFKGGREVGIELEIEKNSGRIHVFRPSSVFRESRIDETTGQLEEIEIPFDGRHVVSKMRAKTGFKYDYRMVFCTYFWKLPILRMVICNRHNIIRWMTKRFHWIVPKSFEFRCCKKQLTHFVCSTAIAHSFEKAGYRLIWKEADFVTPDDLSRSTRLNYFCTLVK